MTIHGQFPIIPLWNSKRNRSHKWQCYIQICDITKYVIKGLNCTNIVFQLILHVYLVFWYLILDFDSLESSLKLALLSLDDSLYYLGYPSSGGSDSLCQIISIWQKKFVKSGFKF